MTLQLKTLQVVVPQIKKLIFLFLVSGISLASYSAPLGAVPTIESSSLRIILDFRSDLWTSPYFYKSAPIRIINGEFRVPLFKTDTWSSSLNITDESLGLGRSDFTLGEKKVFIGDNLRSQSAGMGVGKNFENGSSLSVFAAFATASDKPYVDRRDEWIEANIIYRTAQHDNRSWILAINQSNNRGFANGRPFPYFGVSYSAEPDFTADVGFPFLRLTWGRPETLKKIFQLTPFGVAYDIEKDVRNNFVLRAGGRFTVRSYLHSQRTEDLDRIYYQEFCVEAAARKNLTGTTGVVFGIGYSFDRKLYESKTIYSPNSDYTYIPSDIYGRIAMEFRL